VHYYVLDTEQRTPTVAHHPEAVRDENADYAGISLCDDCHKELHRLSRRGFEMRYKLSPIDLIALTVRRLEEKGMLR
jgi:hypothetical protein